MVCDEPHNTTHKHVSFDERVDRQEQSQNNQTNCEETDNPKTGIFLERCPISKFPLFLSSFFIFFFFGFRKNISFPIPFSLRENENSYCLSSPSWSLFDDRFRSGGNNHQSNRKDSHLDRKRSTRRSEVPSPLAIAP